MARHLIPLDTAWAADTVISAEEWKASVDRNFVAELEHTARQCDFAVDVGAEAFDSGDMDIAVAVAPAQVGPVAPVPVAVEHESGPRRLDRSTDDRTRLDVAEHEDSVHLGRVTPHGSSLAGRGDNNVVDCRVVCRYKPSARSSASRAWTPAHRRKRSSGSVPTPSAIDSGWATVAWGATM